MPVIGQALLLWVPEIWLLIFWNPPKRFHRILRLRDMRAASRAELHNIMKFLGPWHNKINPCGCGNQWGDHIPWVLKPLVIPTAWPLAIFGHQEKGNENYIGVITPIRMAKINNTGDCSCWQGCRVRKLLLCCWWKAKLIQSLWKAIP